MGKLLWRIATGAVALGFMICLAGNPAVAQPGRHGGGHPGGHPGGGRPGGAPHMAAPRAMPHLAPRAMPHMAVRAPHIAPRAVPHLAGRLGRGAPHFHAARARAVAHAHVVRPRAGHIARGPAMSRGRSSSHGQFRSGHVRSAHAPAEAGRHSVTNAPANAAVTRNGRSAHAAGRADPRAFADHRHFAANSAFRPFLRDRWHRHHHLGWVGPLFWPYAYGDFFYYALWPGQYDDADPVWAYGYDDIYQGIFSPYNYDEYVRGSGAPARMTALKQSVAESCTDEAAEVTGWPIDQIHDAVQPNPQQNALLDDLGNAIIKASDVIKAHSDRQRGPSDASPTRQACCLAGRHRESDGHHQSSMPERDAGDAAEPSRCGRQAAAGHVAGGRDRPSGTRRVLQFIE